MTIDPNMSIANGSHAMVSIEENTAVQNPILTIAQQHVGSPETLLRNVRITRPIVPMDIENNETMQGSNMMATTRRVAIWSVILVASNGLVIFFAPNRNSSVAGGIMIGVFVSWYVLRGCERETIPPILPV